MLADLPKTFPGEVNGEPIFGETWDLTSALKLENPGKEIEAGVFQAERTKISKDGIVIDEIWETKYPFLFYRWPETQIEVIKNEGTLRNMFPTPVEIN